MRSESSVLQLSVGDKTFFPRQSTVRDPNEPEPLEPEGLKTLGCRCTVPFRPSWQERPEGQEGGAAPVHSTGDAPAPQTAVQSPSYSAYVPVFVMPPPSADPQPPTLTPTPGPVSDSTRGPLRTEAEAAEIVRTPQLGCRIDCLTNSFKVTNSIGKSK